MSRFVPDTRNIGGRHLVSKIVTNHRRLKGRILSSCSVTVSPSVSRSQHFSLVLGNSEEPKRVLMKRKLSTDCYKPDTFELSKNLSRNKKKRKNFQESKHEDELKILKKKMRKMKFSWFSISDFVLKV